MLDKIEKKIKRIESIYDLLDDIGKDCKEKFLSDKIYQGALLHYLYLISDSVIALSEMVIKYKNLPSADSYVESIDILGEYEVIPAKFAYDFAKIASFRNFLAHDYEKIDYLVICEKSLGKLGDIKTFISYIKKDLDLL